MSLRVGLIGCGNISATYARTARHFPDFRLVACADHKLTTAKGLAAQHGMQACTPSELLRRDDVDAVLVLTPPAAHAEVALAAIEQGKHVYLEKPLATNLHEGRQILDAAAARQLRVGCAPDTVLGAGVQCARQLLDGGAIGRPLTGSAMFMSHGMEHFHPNPGFFYQPGGGPVMDRGPYDIAALVTLLGPVASVMATGQVGNALRTISAPQSARRGQQIKVEVLTTVQGVLLFACGAQISFFSSWDAWPTTVPSLEIHGTAGALQVPDANWFGGVVQWSVAGQPWQRLDTQDWPNGRANTVRANGQSAANYRGLGLADMARAIREGREHRSHGDLAWHVLAVMAGLERAAAESVTVPIVAPFRHPAALSATEAALLIRP